ncbi:MAG: hypothetical protein NTV49_05335 [Kiritimatiellaeota bacterium]|nr:hypothetical protein [Kiritimatiellota bacterium]
MKKQVATVATSTGIGWGAARKAETNPPRCDPGQHLTPRGVVLSVAMLGLWGVGKEIRAGMSLVIFGDPKMAERQNGGGSRGSVSASSRHVLRRRRV